MDGERRAHSSLSSSPGHPRRSRRAARLSTLLCFILFACVLIVCAPIDPAGADIPTTSGWPEPLASGPADGSHRYSPLDIFLAAGALVVVLEGVFFVGLMRTRGRGENE